jgi:hypothetical protein
VRILKAVQQRIIADVTRDVKDRTALIEREIERYARRIREIEDYQAHLVQQHYKGLVSDEVLAREQQRLADEKATVGKMRLKAEVHAGEVAQRLRAALERATDPQATYAGATPMEGGCSTRRSSSAS